MQNQTLPIAASPVAVAPVVNRANVQPNSDAAMFSQTLNREMAQRQSAAFNVAPEPAPVKATSTPAAPAPAAPQAPRTDKHIANADASKDSTGAAAPEADSADAATDTSPAGTKAASTTTTDAADPAADAASAAAAADGAAAAAPMADMLALVASYKQLLQGGATGKAPAAADASAGLKATRGTSVAADAHTLATLQGALKKTDGAVADAGKDAGTGKPAATAASAVQPDDDGKTAATPKTAPDIAAVATRAAPQSETALATLREAATTAASKDTAPVTGSAFQAQLSSAEMAQNAVTPTSNAIPARVGTTAWDTQVSQKVVWMVGGEDQTASLTLNPPDLGPVQVVLNVNNDQATVAFHSATPEVREALENAMPRLRDMLSDAGVTLGEASVSANMPDQRQADTSQGGNQGNNARGSGGNGNGVRSGETEVPIPRATRTVRSDGGLDTFA